MLSLKLATSNIRKGFKSFAPFLMACITMFVMIFVTASIGLSPSIDKLKGGSAVAELMGFALIILTIFSILILIYSYRFLQLQRSKEFGLYDILGFGKVRIAGVAFLELLLSYIITVVIGTVCGIAFSKFLYLIFVNLIGGNYFNLAINPIAIGIVMFIYAIFFLILMIIGSFIIWKSSSLDLLREESKGEKEPKSNIFFAGLAVILLGAGYYVALTVENPIAALVKFFIAVLLVIFGTYFFYVSFTVWYLKRKKKRPSYYKPNNFITTSSMLYRMKANAVGLGNITILLSMTIVTVIVSLGIFFGTENMVKTQFPKEAQITSFGDKKTSADLSVLTEKAAAAAGVKVNSLSTLYMSPDLEITRKAGSETQFIARSSGSTRLLDQDDYFVTLTTIDSLKSLGNQDLSALTENQVLLLDLSSDKKSATTTVNTVNWYGHQYNVAGHLKSVKNFPEGISPTNSLLMVFANDKIMNQELKNYNSTKGEQGYTQLPVTMALFEVNKADEKKLTTAFNRQNGNDDSLSLSYRTETWETQRAQIGGFVFIGFVLGTSFILGAALIIYYKQLSEGAQDKRSFKILQEVGLSKAEVQKTIKSQVRMIFFLPLLITILHLLGAYRMIDKILMIFGVMDSNLTLTISLITIASCAAIYYLIYKITSGVYYKIVER